MKLSMMLIAALAASEAILFANCAPTFNAQMPGAPSGPVPVIWSTLQNMATVGTDNSGLEQTSGSGWGSAWARSNQTFSAPGGSVSYTVQFGSGSDPVQGLIDDTDTPISYTDIAYGFQNETGGVSIYENGSNYGIRGGALTSGDVVTISWNASNQITYAINGTIAYTSSNSPVGKTLRPCVASDNTSTTLIWVSKFGN